MPNMRDKVENGLVRAAGFVGDTLREGIIRRDDEIAYQAADEATQRERDRMIHAAIAAFIELDADNETIYGLLDKYFGVTAIRDATEYTKHARINSQYYKLKEYKQKQGMTPPEFRAYLKETHFEERMESEAKLRTISAEKLAAALEKK